MKKKDAAAVRPPKHIAIKKRMAVIDLFTAWLERHNLSHLAGELTPLLEYYLSDLEKLEIEEFRSRGFNADGTIPSPVTWKEKKAPEENGNEALEKEYEALVQSFLKAQGLAISLSTATDVNIAGNKTQDNRSVS